MQRRQEGADTSNREYNRTDEACKLAEERKMLNDAGTPKQVRCYSVYARREERSLQPKANGTTAPPDSESACARRAPSLCLLPLPPASASCLCLLPNI